MGELVDRGAELVDGLPGSIETGFGGSFGGRPGREGRLDGGADGREGGHYGMGLEGFRLRFFEGW